MTPTTSERLEALAMQWRHNAQGCGRRDAHAAGTWRSCARELDALRASLPEPGVVSDEAVRVGLCRWFEDASGGGLGTASEDTDGWWTRMRAALQAALPHLTPPTAPEAAPAGEVDCCGFCGAPGVRGTQRIGDGSDEDPHEDVDTFTYVPQPAPAAQGVTDALAVVNEAANDARHAREYKKANALVKARITLWKAATAQQPVAEGERLPTLDGFRGLHPDTLALVRRFAYALACKLSAAEQKYGYSDGWANDDWMDECRQKLVEHVAKGDPRDVAAYCAFLWHHGERTELEQPVAVDGWVPIDESQPPRNSMAVYWHKSSDGLGFPCVADEWRDELHRDHSTHWHPGASLAPGAALRSGSQGEGQ